MTEKMWLAVLLLRSVGGVKEEKLEDVRFETMLLEKQLEFARLELEESRARHERDMRSATVR